MTGSRGREKDVIDRSVVQSSLLLDVGDPLIIVLEGFGLSIALLVLLGAAVATTTASTIA